MRRRNYEEDDATFPADAYSVDGYRGIRVLRGMWADWLWA